MSSTCLCTVLRINRRPACALNTCTLCMLAYWCSVSAVLTFCQEAYVIDLHVAGLCADFAHSFALTRQAAARGCKARHVCCCGQQLRHLRLCCRKGCSAWELSWPVLRHTHSYPRPQGITAHSFQAHHAMLTVIVTDEYLPDPAVLSRDCAPPVLVATNYTQACPWTRSTITQYIKCC
jgi:hypothetical protein